MQKAQKAKLIFYVLLTVCLLLLLVGCQQTQDGKSAYQIALDNGFVGTEAEWLESLKGKDSPKITLEEMYQSAKDNGYEGEFLDFLKEYLMTETSTDFVYSSNKALRSVLSVQAKHVGTTISSIPFYGYVEEEVECAADGSGVIFRLDEQGERTPVSVAGYDREKGTVTVMVQAAGRTTKMLHTVEEGDYITDFVGPLGHPTVYDGLKKVCVVGGGVGCAIAYPIAQEMYKRGIEVTFIAGFRSSDIVILKDELAACSNKLIICTDDGSYGEKGFTTQFLK